MTPRSKARRTIARPVSSGLMPPKLCQRPSEIAGSTRPLPPQPVVAHLVVAIVGGDVGHRIHPLLGGGLWAEPSRSGRRGIRLRCSLVPSRTIVSMEERPLGGSGIAITRIVLGCGSFGGIGSSPAFFGQGTSKDEAFRLMDTAWDLGITTFDTADAYGGGRSESFIGEWLATKSAGVRDRIVIATKTFNPMDEGQDHGLGRVRIRRQLESSLRRLGVERVALYLAHAFDPDTPQEETLQAFGDLVRAGKIGAVGASNFTGEQLAEALELSELEGLPRYEWVQNGFSLLEQGDRESVFPVCREHGLGYTPFSPLAGGWLTGKYRRGETPPPGSRMTLRPEPYAGYGSDRVFDALEALEREAARARRFDGGPGARLGAVPAGADGRHRRPRPRRPPGGGVRGARHPPLPRRPRPSDGGLLVSVLVLSEHDVRELLDMESCVAAMEDVLGRLARGEVTNPLRSLMLPPGPAVMGLMPAHAGGETPVFALKEIVVAPANSERGLDPHQGAVLLHDGVTGQLLAVLNASPVTEIRTAAVSAVATKLLARPGSRTVAVLGSGVQGRSHVDAMQTVLEDPIVRIWSRNPAHAEALALETHSLVAASVEEALDGADVVCTATAASEPIVELGWLAPGTHSMRQEPSRTEGRGRSARRPWQQHDSSSTGASPRSTRPATTCAPSRSRASAPTTSSRSWASSSTAPRWAVARTRS